MLPFKEKREKDISVLYFFSMFLSKLTLRHTKGLKGIAKIKTLEKYETKKKKKMKIGIRKITKVETSGTYK